ncbi:MAG: peptidoglycan-binding protein [Kovacikia sp.]
MLCSASVHGMIKAWSKVVEMNGSLERLSKVIHRFQPWFTSWVAIGLLGTVSGWAGLSFSTTEHALGQPSGRSRDNGAAATTTEGLSRLTLKSGSKGNEVSELQATLKLLGYYKGAVDGVYGETTVTAVSLFQQAAGLNADGITGPATWNRLFPPTPPVSTASFPVPATNRPSGSQPINAASPQPTNQPTNQSMVQPWGAALSQPTNSATSAKPASPAPAFPSPSSLISSPTPQVAVPPLAASSPGKKPNPITNTHSSQGSIAANSSSAAASELVSLPILRVGMKGPAVTGLQRRLRAIGVLKSAADGVFGSETQEAVKAAQRKFKLEADGVVGPSTWIELMQ